MKTNEKAVIEKGSEKREELRECLVLWKNVSKNNVEYLKGYTSEEKHIDVVGYFNTNKKNPKEPDIRVYCEKEGENAVIEVCSLWDTLSKNNTRYLTGKTNEDEKVIGFYDGTGNRPYIKVYYK